MKRYDEPITEIHGFPLKFLDELFSVQKISEKKERVVFGEEVVLFGKWGRLKLPEIKQIEREYRILSQPFTKSLDDALALLDGKYKELAKRADEHIKKHGERDMFDPENQKLMELFKMRQKIAEGKKAIELAEKVSPELGSQVTSQVKQHLVTQLVTAKSSYGVTNLNTPVARLVDKLLSLIGNTRLQSNTSHVINQAENLIARPHR